MLCLCSCVRAHQTLVTLELTRDLTMSYCTAQAMPKRKLPPRTRSHPRKHSPGDETRASDWVDCAGLPEAASDSPQSSTSTDLLRHRTLCCLRRPASRKLRQGCSCRGRPLRSPMRWPGACAAPRRPRPRSDRGARGQRRAGRLSAGSWSCRHHQPPSSQLRGRSRRRGQATGRRRWRALQRASSKFPWTRRSLSPARWPAWTCHPGGRRATCSSLPH